LEVAMTEQPSSGADSARAAEEAQRQRIEEAKRRDERALDGTPVEQLERERRERLAPENRPDNAEVDNTQRDFDVEKGMFTDEPGYEEAPKRYPPLGEGGA
jgi:hypothetical protein